MIKDLLRGHWGVDVLAVMAMVTTVAVGEYLAALVIVLMLSGGKALEDYAAGRAKRELTALLARAPQVAHPLQADTDDISDVRVTQVRPGDRLLVRPSEVVPLDGELLSPEASLDESSLTGESLSVSRRTGDALLSGSLNGGVAIAIRATARVEDSQYQRIVALVEEASRSRAPLVRLADRYAVPFTTVSLLIAGIAWWVSGRPGTIRRGAGAGDAVSVAHCCTRGVHGRDEPGCQGRHHCQRWRHARATGPDPYRGIRQDRHPDLRATGPRRT
jgi:cation transport ATPase